MALVTNCANTAATHTTMHRRHVMCSASTTQLLQQLSQWESTYTHAHTTTLPFPLFAALDYDIRVLFLVLLEWNSMCNESRRVPQEGAQW